MGNLVVMIQCIILSSCKLLLCSVWHRVAILGYEIAPEQGTLETSEDPHAQVGQQHVAQISGIRSDRCCVE